MLCPSETQLCWPGYEETSSTTAGGRATGTTSMEGNLAASFEIKNAHSL